MRRFIHLLSILPGLAVLAFAADGQQESFEYKVELFGSAGYGKAGKGRGSWGAGPDFGGGVGLRPFSGAWRGLGFEAQVARLTDQESGVLSRKLDSVLVAGNALYHFFVRGRAQPYVSAGFGYLNADYTRTCTGCVFEVDPTTGQLTPILQQQQIRSRKAVFTLGGGLKIAIHRHLWVRPEVSGSGGDKSFFRFRLGLGFHF